MPRKIASHDILGRVSAAAAGRTGLERGNAGHRRRRGHDRLGACGAGVVGAGDVLLKFGGSVDILTATDRATPDARLYLDYHLRPGLFVPNGCMSTGGSALNWFAQTFAGGFASEAAEPRVYDPSMARPACRGAAGRRRTGWSILPYFLGEKTPMHDPSARGRDRRPDAIA